MTDEKIEKGLECCTKLPMSDCDNCPYEPFGCKQELLEDALDCIVSQKTYISHLKAEKAVSNRALELAVIQWGDVAEQLKNRFIEQAKQELEKEKAKNV